MAKRVDIMLPTPYTGRLMWVIGFPCIVQPKLEGDRARAKQLSLNEWRIYSSSGAVRVSVPLILKELEAIKPSVELDGELYVHGMRHSEIRSIVSRTKNINPKHPIMEYWVYDCVTEDSQESRIALVKYALKRATSRVKVVPSFLVRTVSELQMFYTRFLNEGYEGIIIRDLRRPYVRKRVPWMLKLKPRLSGEYRIIDWQPLRDKNGVEHPNILGAFVLQDDQSNCFSVGTGFTASDRKLFASKMFLLKGTKCKIRFQDYTKVRKVPKMQSVDKEWLRETRSWLG